jgi:tRNA(adenine34) deaminase
MELALEHARQAQLAGEVPVGAVLVRDGVVIGSGRNMSIAQSDPSAHAEILALREASSIAANHRLDDCTLYSTLEPCAMCAGAMLHARISRLVFAAPDPKTGVAGSVLNLFEDRRLNHHTKVTSGVLAEHSESLLKAFFRDLRRRNAVRALPLREDALRTPDERFADLPEYAWTPHYVCVLPSVTGLRLHYLDEGSAAAPLVFLCLHGGTGWSYQFHRLLPVWINGGCRVVAPDFVGFGKSDKLKRADPQPMMARVRCVLDLIELLDLSRVVLVAQDGSETLMREVVHKAGGRLRGLLALRSGTDAAVATQQVNLAAYEAPFPDSGFKAAMRSGVPENIFPQEPPPVAAAQTRREGKIHYWHGLAMLARTGAATLRGEAARLLLDDIPMGTYGPIPHEFDAQLASAAFNYFSASADGMSL